MRARTNISLRERKVFEINNLLGVDFSSSPLDVQRNRAVDMKNIINKNGVNMKRNGWRQVLGFGDDIMINGIFQYRAKDNREWLVVHAGADFYKVMKGSFVKEKISVSDGIAVRARRSEGFLRDGRLYIVGAGDYLVYGSWDDGKTFEIRRVEDDEDTYIPTTTININCMDESADDVQGTLDEPNLLCSKRINRLVGAELASGEKSKSWQLDSLIEANTEVTVKVEKLNDKGELEEEEYINNNTQTLYKKGHEDEGEKGSVSFNAGVVSLNFSTKPNSNMDNITVTFTPIKKESEKRYKIIKTFSYETVGSSEYIETITIDEKIRTDKRVLIEFLKSGEIESVENMYRRFSEFPWRGGVLIKEKFMDGTIYYQNRFEGISDGTGNVDVKVAGSISVSDEDKVSTIAFKYNPYQSEDVDCIVVTYYPVEEKKKADEEEKEEELVANDIKECTFGTLFGVYGNTDRLFLSGNPDRPNMDFYSAADDYTYFTASQCAVMGSDASPVSGYARLSDSTLAIFKENAEREASIYFRSGRLDEEYDSEGNLVDGMAIFPLTAGALGETIVSRYAGVNFAGDNIILSSNGVFGIVLGENVALTERHTRERSRAINKRLLAHSDLSEAVGVVFENRYYLAIDGVCYVADARYKYRRKDDIDGSYNYEWWYLDNIPAHIWAVIDGKLYFGTVDGRICVFDGEYTDRSFFETKEGDIGGSTENTKFTVNKDIQSKFEDGDELEILTDSVYTSYFEVTGVNDNGDVEVSSDDILKVYEGTELYADNVVDSGLKVNTKYVVGNVDLINNCFTLLTADSDEVTADSDEITADSDEVTAGSLRLHRLISGKKLKVINKNDESNSFELALWEDEYQAPLQISAYGGTMPSNIKVKITHSESIPAEWRSGYFDLGTNMASKTLLGLTVTAEPEFDGAVSVGFDTRFHDGSFLVRGERGFSFDNFDFLDFSFDGFVTSYTRRFNKRNVNYISLYFKSEDDKCCAINSIALLYKINKNNIGVV